MVLDVDGYLAAKTKAIKAQRLQDQMSQASQAYAQREIENDDLQRTLEEAEESSEELWQHDVHAREAATTDEDEKQDVRDRSRLLWDESPEEVKHAVEVELAEKASGEESYTHPERQKMIRQEQPRKPKTGQPPTRATGTKVVEESDAVQVHPERRQLVRDQQPRKSKTVQAQTRPQEGKRLYDSEKRQAEMIQARVVQALKQPEVPIQTPENIAPRSLSGLAGMKRKRTDTEPPPTIDAAFAQQEKATQPQPPSSPQRTPSDPRRSQMSDSAPEPRQYGPNRRGPRNKDNSGWLEKRIIDTHRKPSIWYEALDLKKYTIKRDNLQTLAYTNTLITNCIAAASTGEDIEPHTSKLRARLHEIEFAPWLNEGLVKKSKVLEKDGLCLILKESHKLVFSWDIRADAEALWTRWMRGDLDHDLLRGIQVIKGTLVAGKKRTSYRLKKDYALRKDANVIGPNDLVNGQWWPSRICALRDGAHGEQEAGIHGQSGQGAYSVVIAAGGYDDKDLGSTIEYCGTASETSTSTKSTTLMVEAMMKEQHIRVLRATNKKSEYAPKEGIRFDGMYRITGKETLDPKTAMFRFTLRRLNGQDPIRYRGPEIRPTEKELEERSAIKKILEQGD